MSLFCIGDLHGRYDLFTMALEKIGFNYEKDKLYLLGDVLDINYGAIKTCKHIMKYPNAFELIIGNHEFRFMDMIDEYDIFMLHDDIRLKVKKVMDNYLNDYDSISNLVKRKMKEKNIHSIRNLAEIIAWLKSKKRTLLLEAVIDLIEYLNYNEKKFSQINWVLANTNGVFKTKQFVKELLEIGSEEYIALKEYLSSKKVEIKFTYHNKEYYLIHSLTYNDICLGHIADTEVSNQYVIFGHVPVVKIYNIVNEKNFHFSFREILSYIDRFSNHYYNLDMRDNCAAVLRLDDFEEFYVMNYRRGAKSEAPPPIEPVNIRKVGYKKVDAYWTVYKNRKGFSIVTYKDYCMEYLIGVNKFKKEIYYKRVNYMQFYHVEVIEGWYDNHDIEEVILKVAEDYDSKKESEVFLSIEKELRRRCLNKP